jgi:transposase InsO family protein
LSKESLGFLIRPSRRPRKYLVIAGIAFRELNKWVAPLRLEVTTLYIAPGSPWENGYVESLIGKLRDELLSGEIFYTLREAQVLIERWRREYNQVRPHSSLGYRPPAPEEKFW